MAYTRDELIEAGRVITSLLEIQRLAQQRYTPNDAQWALVERNAEALNIVSQLILNELRRVSL